MSVYPLPERGLALPPVEVVDTLDAAALVELATHAAALQSRATARLALLGAQRGAHGTTQEPERLLTVHEAHARTTLSVGWLYRHADQLPFVRRVGRKVLCSETGLNAWLARQRRS